jgi:hypothetical protein
MGMSTTTTPTMEDRLGAVGRRIDKLQAKAQAGTAESRSTIQRQVDKLRGDASAVRKAHGGDAEEKMSQLEAKTDIAQHRVTSELADNWKSFSKGVEGALGRWDAYLDRLQASASAKTGAARKQADSTIAEIGQRRDAVAKSLADAKGASGEAWREQKTKVAAALDKLEDAVKKSAKD